nr:immunoglobulin light chain junction region [Macaca mulatta]
CQHYDSDSLTF